MATRNKPARLKGLEPRSRMTCAAGEREEAKNDGLCVSRGVSLCGARYHRREVLLPIKDVGIFECQCCGVVVERWHGRLVPVLKLFDTPKEDEPPRAAQS